MCDFNFFISEDTFEKYSKCLKNTYEKHHNNNIIINLTPIPKILSYKCNNE